MIGRKGKREGDFPSFVLFSLPLPLPFLRLPRRLRRERCARDDTKYGCVADYCSPKRSQKSLHPELVPILPRVSEVGHYVDREIASY